MIFIPKNKIELLKKKIVELGEGFESPTPNKNPSGRLTLPRPDGKTDMYDFYESNSGYELHYCGSVGFGSKTPINPETLHVLQGLMANL